MTAHKWAEVIHAFAEGYTIQKLEVLCCDRSVQHWEDIEVPMFIETEQYRIKPYNDLWEENNE
jgi:hypothetical protein